MGLNTTFISRSPSYSFPNFLSFDCPPNRGPNLSVWHIKPIRDWGLQEAALKKVTVNTAAGSVIGGGTVAAWKLLGLEKITDAFTDAATFKKIKDCIITGCIVGSLFGAVKGIYETQRFYIERPLVVEASQKSIEKAKMIIQKFVSSHEHEYENAGILCPIAGDIMVFPVRTRCNSPVPHYFDYFRIFTWIVRGNKTCPLCREDIEVRDLTFDPEKEREIHDTVAIIFTKMEAILQRLPKRFLGFDDLPHLSDTTQVTTIAARIKEGKELLEGNVEDIVQKIQQPETLSDSEALALAYYLIHQMKPLKKKTARMYRIGVNYLADLRSREKLDSETFKEQMHQLEKWHSTFNIIPQECKILQKLYRA